MISEAAARLLKCPFNKDALCTASECMLWDIDYNEVEREIPLHDDLPKGMFYETGKPVENGFRVIIEMVPSGRGDCSMKNRDTYYECNYPC